ncbi:hypothetical protein HQ584_03760 [Patescibacteria group bacterium]|nr:hypothetical protein [Patescibacteria group bacterium]
MFKVRSLSLKEMNAWISGYAEDLGVSSLIDVLEPAEEKIIQSERKEADVLMVFTDIQKDDPASAGIIPGKLLKLLPLGIPILAIGRKDSDVGKILNKTKTGFLVSNFEQLNVVMEKMLSGDSMPSPVRDEIQKFSSESQCGKLCCFLDQFIIKPGSI